ncbi:hypothetical protein [Streptomyces antimycoticus]
MSDRLNDIKARELENRVEQLTDELAKYVGKEPTVAEEMAYLNRCLNAVYDLCEQTKKNARRWENPLPVPEWVDAVEQAADGQRDGDGSSPWVRAVSGLNALVDAGVSFWIEPDGHISNPTGDEHIEYDHETERWRLVHDEEEA